MMRTFPLINHRLKSAAVEYILNLPDGRYCVDVRVDSKKRTPKQNRRYRAILKSISLQHLPNGIQYSDEVWHEYFKNKFLPKNAIVVDGQLEYVTPSTTEQNTVEFNDYMTKIEVWCAEHNVPILDDEEAQDATA